VLPLRLLRGLGGRCVLSDLLLLLFLLFLVAFFFLVLLGTPASLLDNIHNEL
jgi:hypothetical protein